MIILMQLHLHQYVKILSLLIISSCTSSKMEMDRCQIISVDGIFFCEMQDYYTLDDMILREASIVTSTDGIKPDYTLGLYLLGKDLMIGDLFDHCPNNFKSIILDKIEKKYILNLVDVFRMLPNSDLVVYNSQNYLRSRIKVEYISMGIQKINFIENNKIITKEIPVRIILNIHEKS